MGWLCIAISMGMCDVEHGPARSGPGRDRIGQSGDAVLTERIEPLRSFVNAAHAAFGKFAVGPEARRSVGAIFAALQRPGDMRSGPGSRLPACGQLKAALSIDTSDPVLLRLVERFKAIEPDLQWSRKTNHDGSASANFDDGHANAMIVGPGGLEARRDLWLGVTLMAPDVRYPDHDHAPEEVYLVLTPGEFRQGQGLWFAPGLGGSFYNMPGIRHAMRSVDAPFLAFWALSADT
jgi:hypothetical protein